MCRRSLCRSVGIGLLLAMVAALPAAGKGVDDPKKLTISGTGSALGTIKLLAREFKKLSPGADIEVLPSVGSSGAIKAVLAGALDIGFTSRPLTGEEKGQGLIEQELGKTPFVFCAARGANIRNISLADLARIFNGTLTTWPDGSPLRLVLRPLSDTDTQILKSISPSMSGALESAHRRSGIKIAMTDQDSADAIENIPGAISTCTLALILSESRKIEILSVDGVQPTLQNLKNGTYPYSKKLFSVIRKQPQPLAQRFIEFLRSDRGRAILVRMGHWVVP